MRLLAAVTGFELGASQGFASFTLSPPDLLTVSKTGAGRGTVSSLPAGITCGATCSSSFDDGMTVTLTATADGGSTFSGWSGGGCSGNGGCVVTLSADTTVLANFVSGTFSAPTITAFSPGSGGVHATATVTVNGTNFGGATAVKLGGVSAAFSVVSGTQLTFTVPAGAPPQSGTITVTNPGGTGTSSGTFTVLPPPTISSLSPTSGPVGTPVTITGTNLGGTVAVQLGSLITVPTNVSATQATFNVPPGAATGTVKVLGTGGSATGPGTFTVTP
ncbi:MAG: IPT/TIG domain-containing protein [Gaiellaceae bacterium]